MRLRRKRKGERKRIGQTINPFFLSSQHTHTHATHSPFAEQQQSQQQLFATITLPFSHTQIMLYFGPFSFPFLKGFLFPFVCVVPLFPPPMSGKCQSCFTSAISGLGGGGGVCFRTDVKVRARKRRKDA